MADERYPIDRSNLYQVRKQVTNHLGDVNARVSIIEASGTGISAKYLWSNLITGNPTAGHIAANNATMSLVTILRIHRNTDPGNDISAVIQQLNVGSTVGIFGTLTDGSSGSTPATALFTTTGAPALVNGIYFNVPVTPTAYLGQKIPKIQDEPVSLSFTAKTGTISHDELTDVTENQHHSKSHNHDGLDGSGLVSYTDLLNKPTIPPAPTNLHASLTDVTEDQHHPKIHALNTHSDVTVTAPVTDEVLTWDGSKWINKVAGSGGGGVPAGGLTNQVLAKKTDTDYDYNWGYINADEGFF